MKYKLKIKTLERIEKQIEKRGHLFVLRNGILGIVVISFAIEWYRSWRASQYYISEMCQAASAITSDGILLGTTCLYRAGELLSDNVNSHSIDQGYWFGSTLNYFFRDSSSFWHQTFTGVGYSVWHFLIVSGFIVWFGLFIFDKYRGRN